MHNQTGAAALYRFGGEHFQLQLPAVHSDGRMATVTGKRAIGLGKGHRNTCSWSKG